MTEEKLLKIAIVSTESSVLFSIINNTILITVPLPRLYKKRVTTKEQHDDIGLYLVDDIICPLDIVFYKKDYDKLFHQILEKPKGDLQ